MEIGISKFLEQHNIVYNYQFGSRKHHSTKLALTISNLIITSSFNKKNDVILHIFLDFSRLSTQ